MSGVRNTLLAVPLAGHFARQNRSCAAWRKAQDRYVRRIVECAFSRSAFFRVTWTQAGIDPRTVRNLDDLARLPVIGRAAWRAIPDEQIMTETDESSLVWHRTGGSSGAPFKMPYTPDDDVALRATVLAVMKAHGVRWSERALWFLPPDTHSRGGYRVFGRVRMIDSDAASAERLAALRSGSEQVLRGYPWPVWRAVVLALRQGISLPRRRLFVTGGEPLPACVRRTLEQGLGARVVNRYSATDFGQMAAECPAGSLHVCAGTHVEILAGNTPAEAGQEGEVVASNFFSRARPLIRVRTGDQAAWADRPCPCGSGIPHLSHVSGRTEDCIQTPRGKIVQFLDVERALGEAEKDLYGFQAEQTGSSHVLVRLCTRTNIEESSNLSQKLEGLFDGMRVTVEFTDAMPTENNGKTRVCRKTARKSV
jgi:phenylacetate-CoA ligase